MGMRFKSYPHQALLLVHLPTKGEDCLPESSPEQHVFAPHLIVRWADAWHDFSVPLNTKDRGPGLDETERSLLAAARAGLLNIL